MAQRAAADGPVGDAGAHLLEDRDGPKQRHVVAILAPGKVVRTALQSAVGVLRGVHAVFQNGLHRRMGEDDLPRGLLNVATAQAIDGLGVAVRDLVDIRMTAPATDTGMRAAIEEGLIHVEKPVRAFFIDAGQTAEAVAHETVFCIHCLQALQRSQSQQCQNAQCEPQTRAPGVPVGTVDDPNRLPQPFYF